MKWWTRFKIRKAISIAENKIEDEWDSMYDSFIICLRRNEEYAGFEADFDPIRDTAHRYIDKKAREIIQLKRQLDNV